jgi:hypothetical protein
MFICFGHEYISMTYTLHILQHVIRYSEIYASYWRMLFATLFTLITHTIFETYDYIVLWVEFDKVYQT